MTVAAEAMMALKVATTEAVEVAAMAVRLVGSGARDSPGLSLVKLNTVQELLSRIAGVAGALSDW